MTSPPKTRRRLPTGDRPPAQLAGLPTPARRRRPLLLAVGLLLAGLAATVVAVAMSALSASTLVWATAVEVSRGQPVAAGDLVAVEVAASTGRQMVEATPTSRDLLMGRVWAADLPAGQLLSPALMVDRLIPPGGRALVGLRLDPGGLPAAGLAAGDVVQVVAATGPPQVVVDRALVESVVVLSDQGAAAPRLVTVSVPAESAATVAAAAGGLSLVVVP